MRNIVISLLILLSKPSFGYGPFAHMLVADESFSVASKVIKQKFPNLSESEVNNLLPFYNAGSLGPDFGYFPDGELKMSLLAHYLRSGDLIVTMIELSSTPEEYAFSLGWRSHLDADEFAHRYSVNRTAAQMLGIENIYPLGVTYEFDPLVHNKVEAGGDLRLLKEKPDIRNKHIFLAVPLEERFPNNRNFIEEAYLRVYAYRLNRGALISVSRNITNNVHFIPKVFEVMGYLPPKDNDVERVVSTFDKLTMRPVFQIMMGGNKSALGSKAIVSPYIMNDEQWHRHVNSTNVSVYYVKQRLNQDPSNIPNRNLDLGGPIFTDEYDPSATLLLEIEKQHPENTWETEYTFEISKKLISEWNRVLRQYERRSISN